MYKICKTEKSIERQKLFLTTLIAMMKIRKYQEITVTSLCREMEIPRKTFYRYFDTLEDVLYMVIDDALTESFLYLEIKTDAIGFFSYWKEHKELLDILEKSSLSYLLVNRIYERLQIYISKQEVSNEEMMYSGFVSAIMTILLMWHHSGMTQSVEKVSQTIHHMFRIAD